MEIRELSDKLKNSGVAGAGGAGFPSYAKLSDRADTVLLNCAECEPLLSLHRQLLGAHPEEILGALSLVVRTLGAKEGIVAVKAEYTETLRAVRQHIDDFPELRIHELPGAYPMGDEVVLIYECTGRQLRPGGLPIEQGVIVYNVETMFNAWHSITGGAAVTDKLVSVVGEVKEPVTLRAPLGTPMSALVENAGGYTTAHPVLLVGGPMMGRFGQPEDPVTRTTNALLVLGLAGVAVVGGYLLLRARRSKN